MRFKIACVESYFSGGSQIRRWLALSQVPEALQSSLWKRPRVWLARFIKHRLSALRSEEASPSPISRHFVVIKRITNMNKTMGCSANGAAMGAGKDMQS